MRGRSRTPPPARGAVPSRPEQGAGAEEKFKEIAEGPMLSSPTRRSGLGIRQPGVRRRLRLHAEDLFGGIDFGDVFGGPGSTPTWGGGLFDRFRPAAARAAGGSTNLEVDLVVPLERVLTGGEETVRFSRPQPCTCSGLRSGARHDAAIVLGLRRQGAAGEEPSGGQRPGPANHHLPGLRRTGHLIDRPCPDCKGGAEVEREETLTVKVPAGVEEGMVLRIPGHGLPSREAGGTPGDLYVVVTSIPMPGLNTIVPTHLWRVETVEVPNKPCWGRNWRYRRSTVRLDGDRSTGDAARDRTAAFRQRAPRVRKRPAGRPVPHDPCPRPEKLSRDQRSFTGDCVCWTIVCRNNDVSLPSFYLREASSQPSYRSFKNAIAFANQFSEHASFGRDRRYDLRDRDGSRSILQTYHDLSGSRRRSAPPLRTW